MSMPTGKGRERIDRSACRISCLPIGRAWTAPVREQVEGMCARLPGRMRVQMSEPVLTEVDVLERIELIRRERPDALLLAALHGGSARALVLAARKTGVPAVLWCHDEKHSLASACLAMESLRQLGHPCVLIHGCGVEASQDLAAASAAACALRTLSEARIGQVGPLHPNLVSCSANPVVIQKGFGAWTVPIAIAEVRRRCAGLDPRKVDECAGILRQRFRIEADDGPLRKAVALHLTLDEISREQRLDILAVNCWSEILPGFGVAPCMGFAFDDYRIACEGDLLLALALLAGEAISGGPGYAGDLYAFDESSGCATSVHCGACAALHSTEDQVSIVSRAPPDTVEGDGAVISVRPVLPAGDAIVVMFHGANVDQVHIRAAEIIDTTSADHMKVQVRLQGRADLFRSQAAGNHYAIFPGRWAPAWDLLAQWLHVSAH
jgi:L-fucose isomerase-like protein